MPSKGQTLGLGGLALRAIERPRAPRSLGSGDWNTPVLLHFDGANGSTTFINDNPDGPIFSAIPNGIAALSNTTTVFGATCLANGASTTLGGIVGNAPISLPGDFSIEGRHFTTNNTFNGALFALGDNDGAFNANSIVLRQNSDITNDGKMRLTVGGTVIITATTASPNSTFWAYGVFCFGGNIYLTMDGVLQGSAARPAGTLGNDVLYVGAHKVSGALSGVSSSFGFFIDEFRLTNGLARQQTFPYTPAGAAFVLDTGPVTPPSTPSAATSRSARLPT